MSYDEIPLMIQVEHIAQLINQQRIKDIKNVSKLLRQIINFNGISKNNPTNIYNIEIAFDRKSSIKIEDTFNENNITE